MSLKRWCWPVLAAWVVALFAAGCSEAGSQKDEVVPEITAFAADSERVEAGTPVRLTWTTKQAVSVEIADALGGSVDLHGAAPTAGSVEVTPMATTSYVLTAISRTGERATGTVSVEVVPAPDAPLIASFTATPDAAKSGETVTLSWATEHADTVRITRAGGLVVDLQGAAPTSGSVDVPVLTDTSYTLTATGPGGSVEATVQVGLAVAPVATFTGPSAPVFADQPATLRWQSSNATRITIVDSKGTVLVDATDRPSGELVRNEPVGNRFTLTATGPGGTVVREAAIDVQPVIERFAVLTEGPVRAGELVEVEWLLRGASAAALSNLSGYHVDLREDELASGRATVPVGAGGSILLRARDGSLAAETSATVELTHAPRIRLFTSDAPQVSARADLPAAVTLSWEIDGAADIQLEATPGGPIDVFGLSRRADSVSVTITEETAFHLVATNEHGSHELTWTVGVVPAPRIAQFEAIPARVGTGEAAPLVWAVDDAVAIRIERDGVDLGVTPGLTSGSYDDFPLIDSTYVLTATNSLGFEISSDPVQVTIGDPIVALFAVDRPVIPANQDLTFTWENLGGRQLAIVDADGATLCSSTDAAEIRSGACTITAPVVDGLHDYTLRVTNGAGAVTTDTLQVRVVAGPIVQLLEADAPGITIGDPVTFSWQVDNDAQNRTPTLALTDDLGNAYDISASDPNLGSATITPVAAGATTFTLTATTPGTTSSTASTTMVVYGVPTVASLVASPDPIDTGGGTMPATTTLSWTSNNGASVDLYELDASGARIEPPLFTSVDPAEIAGGSSLVTAAIPSTSFLVVVHNGAGASAEQAITVDVDPAEILLFEADPVDLVRGETGLLRWTTARADTVTLSPSTASVTAVANGFQDISASPNAQALSMSSTTGTTGSATLNFPAGFTFPWFGQPRSAIKVMGAGWISFNTSASGTGVNYDLPRSSSSNVAIAPFWEYMRVGSGSVLWEQRTDANGDDYVVIQWNNIEFYTSSLRPSSLNFQLWLHDDGRFEFHYGTMTGPEGTDEALGSSATIGWQDPWAASAQVLSYNEVFPGGLSNKGFVFDFGVPTSGTFGVFADETRTYTLEATNAHSSATAQVEVVVHDAVQIASAGVDPVEPEINTPFQITWNAPNATTVDVLDAQGNVRCSGVGSLSSCAVTETTVGDTTYTVRAVGAVARDVTTATVQTHVWDPISVGFTASSNSLAVGSGVTLSWNNVGVTSITLTADGQPVDLGNASITAGSITLQPAASTLYEMTGTDGLRVRTVQQAVAVRTADMASFTADATQIGSGETVNLTWSSTGAPGVYVEGAPLPANPMTDVSSTVAFEDVSATGTELTLSSNTGYADYEFPTGFAFRYFGEERTKIRVFSYGYVSFNQDASSTSGNTTFPAVSGTQSDVHLAPFWDYLSKQSTGHLYVDLRSDAAGQYLVIQWTNWQFASSSYNTADLNFQVILREDGTFEYRYGTMSGPNANITNGSSAAIGFQDPWSMQGYTVQNSPSAPTPRANTAFRFDLRYPASGSLALNPGETTTYTVCNSNLGYTECLDRRVVVVKPGDVMFSELMIAPANTPDAEWFELRNVAPYPIDLSGFTVTAGPESTTISPSAPLVLQPGAFAVLSHTGGPVADWNYGTDITLDDVGEILVLSRGTTELDRVDWTSLTWTVTQGQSLQLDPSGFQRDPLVNDEFANWCTSTSSEVYDGTNAGTPGILGTGCMRTDYDADVASSLPFLDIASTGTSIPAIVADSGYAAIPGDLGFTMPFFTGSVSQLSATSNGSVIFGAITTSYSSNAVIPSTSTPNGMVAALWDDLDNATGSDFLYEHRTVGSSQVTILQWQEFRRYGEAGRLTFQVQLWDDGDIVIAYKELAGADAYNRGGNATVGIEDAAGTDGIQYLKDQDKLWSGQVIHFRRK